MSKLSTYQLIVDFYLTLQQIYRWTPAEIDATEVELMFDEMEVMDLTDHKPMSFIDDIL